MLIKIRTVQARPITIPVPVCAAGIMLRLAPASAWRAAAENVPDPYKALVSKKTALLYYRVCKEILREYADLEIIRVEAADGTLVSIRL